jgi:hypothetical protein
MDAVLEGILAAQKKGGFSADDSDTCPYFRKG